MPPKQQSALYFRRYWRRSGFTGPAQPFAYRYGLFHHIGKFAKFKLPLHEGGKMVIEETSFKRYPAEGVDAIGPGDDA